jgi:glycine/D-amino acid oxidase-like deaminating enzyme
MESANVVVIGGGIVGTCTALHLCRLGVPNVLVLERGSIASGTTQAGAGFLDMWAANAGWSETEVALEAYALEFYAELSARHEIGLRRNGNVWLAGSQEVWERKLAPFLGHPATPDARALTPAEAAELVSILRPEGLVGAVMQPSAARLSTASAARAIAREIREHGGDVRSDVRVLDIAVAGGRVTGVTTSTGPIATDAVVVAAGAWSNDLVTCADFWIPMVPLIATRFIVPALGIEPDMPSVMFPEKHDLYVRELDGGLSWGCVYRSAPRFDFLDGGLPDRIRDLATEGAADMAQVGREVSGTIPALGSLHGAITLSGAPCHTPDYRPVVGQAPGNEGLWLAAGDNYSGVTHGPGIGRAVAELLTDSPTSADYGAFAPDRFRDGPYRSAADVAASPLVQSLGWSS